MAKTAKLLQALLFGFLFSAIIHAETIETLTPIAQTGDAKAQVELATLYEEKSDLYAAHYWLTKAAIAGNRSALERLGNLFESDETGAVRSLDLAENWFLIASEAGSAEGELGYARVLEVQFNQRRARQISSITLLNSQIENDIQSDFAPVIINSDHTKNRISSEFIITSVTILSLLMIFSFRRWLRIKRERKHADQTETLSSQRKKISTLQRHLSAAHGQLKKQQSAIKKTQADQTLALACAVLGLNPNTLPEEKELKLRYKRLSRIYHPDVSGSDEEMKRLNNAVKIVNQYIKLK